MQTKNALLILEENIQVLEIQQANLLLGLKLEVEAIGESIKPINYVKNTLKEISNLPDFKSELLNTTLAMSAGFFSKKIMVGNTNNPAKIALGTLLQIGVTSLLSSKAENLRNFLSKLNQVFSSKN